MPGPRSAHLRHGAGPRPRHRRPTRAASQTSKSFCVQRTPISRPRDNGEAPRRIPCGCAIQTVCPRPTAIHAPPPASNAGASGVARSRRASALTPAPAAPVCEPGRRAAGPPSQLGPPGLRHAGRGAQRTPSGAGGQRAGLELGQAEAPHAGHGDVPRLECRQTALEELRGRTGSGVGNRRGKVLACTRAASAPPLRHTRPPRHSISPLRHLKDPRR